MLNQIEPFAVNRGLMAIFFSWFFIQGLKVAGGVVREGRINFRLFVRSGGMPSSHSGVVACLSTVVGLYYGFNSIPFLMTCVFSLITMFDAAGVRRAVGKQAGLLNKIVDEISQGGELKEERIRALLGHTPVEVFVGASLGIVIAIVFCLL